MAYTVAGGIDLYQAVLRLSARAYRRLARWPMGWWRFAAYLGRMTTYTTPHFATGLPDGNLRPESWQRARPADAAPYRTAGVSNEAAAEAAAYADGPTPDWQPGVSRGVPKAAIGALGAALVGGVALAIVLMAPSNKVSRPASTNPAAQATASNDAGQRSTDAAIGQMDQQAPAAGTRAAADATAAQQAAPAAATLAPAAPAPAQAVTPAAPPVAQAPVARAPKHAPAARVAPVPVHDETPAVTPDAAPAPMVAPPADVRPPAMQQTPDTTTVTPSLPAPAPTAPAPDTPASPPAPAQ
jgi:hypothetical protein